MTYLDALTRGREVLAAAGIENALREARLLARLVLGLEDAAVADPNAAVDADRFEALLQRRAAREPMAFLRGRQGFWTLNLEVSPATLIPRADTETLIEVALTLCPDRAAVRRVLDLGTGTGALLLAVLEEFPAAFGVGVDLVPDAAALAARNAAAHGLAERAAFLAGRWADALRARFDLVLANPPYIPQAEIAGLMPEVATHEPRTALDGGPDGLDAYRAICASLPRLLAPQGVAVLELGAGQAGAVLALAQAAGLAVPGIRRDLGGLERVLILRRAPS